MVAGNPIRTICSIEDIKNKNKELMLTRPLYDRTFNAIEINELKRQKMKKELSDGYGFYQCENYNRVNNK